MAAKYWIKLYHEILEDSKMGRLPDNLWRRAIELFLMAGELDDQGRLPCTAEIAWRLRQSEEALEADLNRLEAVGILTKNDDDTWLVTNFAKRQAPTETIDRVRQFRERKRKQTPSNKKATGIDDVGYAQVTKSYTDTEEIQNPTTTSSSPPLTEKETLTQIGNLCREYFSDPTQDPFKADLMRTLKKYSADKVLWAIQTAKSPKRQNGKPKSWGYVVGILEKDVLEGKNRAAIIPGPGPPQPSGRGKSPPIDQDLFEQLQAGKK